MMRLVLLCMSEAVNGGFCSSEMLEVLEMMRCVPLCARVVEGGLCLQDVLKRLTVLEAMRCVLLCMLETVEGELCSPYVIEVTRRVLLCMLG